MSGNMEEWSSGLGNQSLGPKDREGIRTILMCEDNNAARQYSDLQNRYNVWYFFSVQIMVPVCIGITLYVGERYWRANPWLHIDTWFT